VFYLSEVFWGLQIIVQYHGTEVADNFVISSRKFQIPVKTVTYYVYTHKTDQGNCSDTWY
jgi:hypothetical protein